VQGVRLSQENFSRYQGIVVMPLYAAGQFASDMGRYLQSK
jgi:hypothetical protein